MRQTILEAEKGKIIALVEAISESNIDESTLKINTHLNFIKTCGGLDYLNFYMEDQTDIEPEAEITEDSQEHLPDPSVASIDVIESSAPPEDTPKVKEAADSPLSIPAGAQEPLQTPKGLTHKISSSANDSNKWVIDRLTRALRGGFLDNGNVFVPEREIRTNEYEDGDWIKATVKLITGPKTFYQYDLIQKRANAPERPRKRLIATQKVILHTDIPDMNYIQVKKSEDELPIQVELSESAMHKMNVETGSVIDYAYYDDDPLHGQIVWKYDTSALAPEKGTKKVKKDKKEPVVEAQTADKGEIDEIQIDDTKIVETKADEIKIVETSVDETKVDETKAVETKLGETKANETVQRPDKNVFSFQKSSDSAIADSLKHHPVKQSFADKVIVVVGGRIDATHTAMKYEIKRRGGNLVALNGKERKDAIRNKIKKADVVIVFTEHVSHEGMFSAKEFCKSFHVPVTYTKSLNIENFLKRIRTLLQKKEEVEPHTDSIA